MPSATMSAPQDNGASNNGAGDKEQAGAKTEGDLPEGNIHHCGSWASFRTATPDAAFGHPLHLAPRAMTRDPTAGLNKCSSSASIRTMTPELGFGHQLRRVAKHEELKAETVVSGAKGEKKADRLTKGDGAKGEERKGDKK